MSCLKSRASPARLRLGRARALLCRRASAKACTTAARGCRDFVPAAAPRAAARGRAPRETAEHIRPVSRPRASARAIPGRAVRALGAMLPPLRAVARPAPRAAAPRARGAAAPRAWPGRGARAVALAAALGGLRAPRGAAPQLPALAGGAPAPWRGAAGARAAAPACRGGAALLPPGDVLRHHAINTSYDPRLRLLRPSPPVYELPGFLLEGSMGASDHTLQPLTGDECRALVELARPLLQPSPVVQLASSPGSGGAREVHGVSASRTSTTCFLARESCGALLAKVGALTGKPRECFELVQVGRYLKGQFYRPHHDALDPHTESWAGSS
ncbi:unnamed protein product [Prorocentrum cordatum]|uniref:Prolyl 4-hydroxylase alpha subunit domain-containing protein n=1 Tax=Prorocentrum cordatum TaxID=2364126 RepID=A0ABN9QED5_9DINO|nr:unnamed protein product [Polarella glacialis]